MYIHEAVKRALEIDGVIYRKSEREPKGKYERSCFTMIKPSNGYECCRGLVFRDGKLDYTWRHWNPIADDLVADDWYYMKLLKGEGDTDEKRI